MTTSRPTSQARCGASRIFFEIAVAPDLWPTLVEAAGFDTMRRDGTVLLDRLADIFEGGSRRFFNKGTNQRWRGVFHEEDLALYDAKMRETLPPDCARWVAGGRAGAGGDPPATA